MQRTIRACIIPTLLTVAAAGVAADETAPAAEWIWTAAPREQGQEALVRKVFNVAGDVARAELRGVADFCHLAVFLNGRLVADVEHYGQAFRQDVNRLIVEGRNVLAARGSSADGPAAIALGLELVFADGSRQTIGSDASWQAAGEAPPQWQESAFVPAKPWTNAASFGLAEPGMWSDPQSDSGVDETDDYTQWQQALASDATIDPSTFLVPAGFELELLRSAGPDEGSWVSLEFDPQGRLIVAREDRGLLRMTLPSSAAEMQVEVINDTLEECRGLLCAHGCLYVNANNSKGLYRLRDTNADDHYDQVELLYPSGGGVGHGRNDLALGPDGWIYSIHGDSVELPQGFADRTSPFREHRRGQPTSEGHLLRFDPDGRHGELIAAGLRNPFGIDFHPDGELFTYDADAEYDMGARWYRPTRIDHLVSGADFGWRGVTGSWPPYYPDHPDNAPASLDIGKGSPTSVKFGTLSHFPPQYRRALFVLDWAYGRILAVQLTPRGASYAARAEVFLHGRPLNVTDLGFGPDGAMYIVTGGRKTQSGLYRVRYIGPEVPEPPPTVQQSARRAFSDQARALRHRLEAFHGRHDSEAIETAWSHMDSPDPWIRHAARIAVEQQPLATWQERALGESRPMAAVTALLALARGSDAELRPGIVARLNELPLAEFSTTQTLSALYCYQLCLAEPDAIDGSLREQVVGRLDPLFPSSISGLNAPLSRLLVLLAAPGAVAKTMELLRIATEQPERLHYLFVLREAPVGWTPELRHDYFLALAQMRGFQGGEGMPKFIQQIQVDALASLTDAERSELEPLLADQSVPEALPAETRPFVRDWKPADLVDALAEVGRGRNFDRGLALFRAALCARCHRVGHIGEAIGPDLTAVGNRFSRRDILESIISPSEVVAEQYRRAQILTADGRILTGQIVPGRDYRSPNLNLATDPLRPDRIDEIPKSSIESHTTTATSLMPEGLLSTLTREEILDLLAWLEAGGDPRRPSFQP